MEIFAQSCPPGGQLSVSEINIYLLPHEVVLLLLALFDKYINKPHFSLSLSLALSFLETRQVLLDDDALWDVGSEHNLGHLDCIC